MKFAGVNYLEVAGAFCVIAVGAFAIWHGSSYDAGTLTHMGPGYFPVALGVVLVGLGVILLVQAPAAPTVAVAALRFRGAAAVFGSVAAFAFLLPRLGLVAATFALVVIASIADRGFRLVPTILLATALAGLAVAVFIHGLGMPLHAFLWE